MTFPSELISYAKTYNAAYYLKHRERMFSPEKKEQISIKKKIWYQENKDIIKEKNFINFWKKTLIVKRRDVI